MKVIDIIKSPLNEGLSQVAIKELVDLAGRAIARAQKYGKELPSISDLLRRAGVTATPKELAVIEKEAMKRAVEITKAEEKAAAGAARQSSKAAWAEGFDKAYKYSIGLGLSASAYGDIKNYYDRMDVAYSNWQTPGGWTEGQYKGVREKEMAALIAKLAGTTLLVGGTGAIGAILKWAGGFPIIGFIPKMLGGLTKPMQIAMVAWFATGEGKQWMAEVVVYSLADSFEFLRGTPLDHSLSEIIGPLGTKIVDAVKSALGAAGVETDKVPGQDQQSTKPVDPNADKDSTANANKPTAPVTGPAANLPDELEIGKPGGTWVNIGGRRYKNKQTGDVQVFESKKR
jgi:hypothetical protein